MRPAVVVNDPALSASQPEPGLAASAANALGHAVEAPLTPRANPVATLAAARAAELILAGFAGPEPDRDALALGALLAGYAMDSTGYGLHHVLSQTLARRAGVGHGPANAAMLPHSVAALAERFPEEAGLGALAAGAARLAARAGAARLRDLGVAPGGPPGARRRGRRAPRARQHPAVRARAGVARALRGGVVRRRKGGDRGPGPLLLSSDPPPGRAPSIGAALIHHQDPTRGSAPLRARRGTRLRPATVLFAA